MADNRVAAIVVTHDRKEKLCRCVRAILQQTSDVRPDIIVVDNNSSDGTSDLFAGSEPVFSDERILYFNTGYNSGGAGGFCFGLRQAARLGYGYVWMMDDDCVPSVDALEVFLAYDRDHRGEYGFLTGKVLWRDGSICKMNVPRRSVTRKVTEWDSSVIEVEIASFVSLFIPMDIVMEAGLPFRQFFIWTDDWEYTRRISLRHHCYLLPGSVSVHDMDVNSKADISSAPDDMLYRFRYRYRNDVYLYRREGLRGQLYEAAMLTMHAARVLLSSRSAAEKAHRIGIIIRGTIDGLSFFPEPERAAGPEDTE